METAFPEKMKVGPRFRNDDVSFDTELEYFKPFCEIFWKHGLTQTHAITLNGLCNYKYRYGDSCCVYEGLPTLSYLSNPHIRELSQPYAFRQRRDLIEFLAASPDEIALHGRYHCNFAAMDEESQYEDMGEGLAELHELFPSKAIRFFVPPFNKFNRATIKAANRAGLRVLGDEGVHLEDSLDDLHFYPGIWYRYHHHRFYPGSTFDAMNLNMRRLDEALDRGLVHYCQGRLPIPSFDYEGDALELKKLIELNQAQNWYLGTALNRRERLEMALAMSWIYSRIEYDQAIFEVGCGAGNNLHWLACHGYDNLGGSDIDPKALEVARGMALHEGFSWNLTQGNLLEPEHIPENVDVILAINCLYCLPEFDPDAFLSGCARRLSENGYVVMDQIDSSFDGHPLQGVPSSQWDLERHERTRPGEYRKRVSCAQMRKLCLRHNLRVVAAIPSLQQIPRVLYVLGKGQAKGMARRPLPALWPAAADVLPAISAIFESGLFDWAWYRDQYVRGPEIMNPLEHYVRFGAAQGRWPNPSFDTDAYRMRYMQLLDPTNPLLHYLLRKAIEDAENGC